MTRVELTRTSKHATGVIYVDALGREFRAARGDGASLRLPDPQRAADAAERHRHALRPRDGAGPGGPQLQLPDGRDRRAFFEKERFNQFAGAGALGAIVDEFNGDNFDHGPHGFIGGGYLIGQNTGLRPIEQRVLPADSPRWGEGWKKANNKWYDHNVNIGVHGGSTSRRQNYISLDPTYTDDLGQPLARMTFDFSPNDLRMREFLLARAAEIAHAMEPDVVNTSAPPVPASVVPYQTTHICGGAIMGSDPGNSAVNRRLQSWDVPNVFAIGRERLPAERGLQPHEHGGRADLLVAAGDQGGLPQEPGAAGRDVAGAAGARPVTAQRGSAAPPGRRAAASTSTRPARSR